MSERKDGIEKSRVENKVGEKESNETLEKLLSKFSEETARKIREISKLEVNVENMRKIVIEYGIPFLEMLNRAQCVSYTEMDNVTFMQLLAVPEDVQEKILPKATDIYAKAIGEELPANVVMRMLKEIADNDLEYFLALYQFLVSSIVIENLELF